MNRRDIVQDGTMGDQQRARSRIDEALARGPSVQVLPVFSPIEQAVSRLGERGVRTGRSVDRAALARSHWPRAH